MKVLWPAKPTPLPRSERIDQIGSQIAQKATITVFLGFTDEYLSFTVDGGAGVSYHHRPTDGRLLRAGNVKQQRGGWPLNFPVQAHDFGARQNE